MAIASPAYYSITQAAALLGVSRVSVWRWIRAGQLPAARLGHRTTRIKRTDLEQLLLRLGARGARGASAGLGGDGAVVPGGAAAAEHLVQFYESDAFLLDAVADFMVEGLRGDDAGVVVATLAHREGIAARLGARGIALEQAVESGRYVALDASNTLARFMRGDTPDAARFAEVIGGVVERASAGGRTVRAFGEMVALLVDEGKPAAAIRLEALWKELQRRHGFSLFCGYPIDRFGDAAMAQVMDEVCAEHTRVVPAESYASLVGADAQARAVAALQQKAQTLEAEVAHRQRAEAQLRAALEAERIARAATEAALQKRDEFLSIAAHELRTPLTALSGNAQMLQRWLEREGALDVERLQQGLQAIRGQGAKLARLVSQLLDITRLDGGKLTLERRTADLRQLAEQAVAGARSRTEQHTITLTAPESLPADVDALRLDQVLTNLLDNAIKYSPDGGQIEVSVSHPEAGAAQLSVRDHGLGIPPEQREHIFERFYQAHSMSSRSGLGLGLYICRQIVELHGGRIWAEFPEDGGTRFSVVVPVGRGAAD